jgi:hypothetical protein
METDPFEHEGEISPGGARVFTIQCNCQTDSSTPSSLNARWKKVPGGPWHEVKIPLKVKAGVPQFKLQNPELDFNTVYIETEKTLEMRIFNDGNALCSWTSQFQNEFLSISPPSGQLQAGESAVLCLTFAPKTYDMLNIPIRFTTDAGSKTLTCYGIVGVPFLRIPLEHLNLDFEVQAVGKPQSRPVTLKNTGAKPIEFQIANTCFFENGTKISQSDLEVFRITPESGTIPPGDVLVLQIQVKTAQYLAMYEVKYDVITKDGELYHGNAKAIGGQAIVRFKPSKPLEKKPREKSVLSKEAQKELLMAQFVNLREIITGWNFYFGNCN